jgi:hypothetical protein
MDMDQAAVFLAGSILTALGILALLVAVVVINNILHKYWKPIAIFTPDSWKGFHPPMRFEESEKQIPHLEENKK